MNTKQMPLNREELLKQGQVKLLYEALPMSIVANLINAIVLVFVTWNVIEHTLLIGWLISVFIISAVRSLGAVAYHRIKSEADKASNWEIYFTIGAVFSGIIWCSASLILFPENSIVHQVFIAFIVGGMCAGAVVSLSPLPIPIFSFLLLALLPLSARFFMVGTEMANAMGVMVFLFLIMVSISALRVYRNVKQNIVLRMKNEEQAAAILENKLEQQVVLDNVPMGIWLVGVDGRYRFVNKTFCDAVGIPESEFLSTTHLPDLLGEEMAAHCLKSDRECLEREGPQLSYETLTFVDGKQHLMEITKAKVRDNTGTVTGVLGIAMDITERQLAEDKLRKLSQATEQAGESVIITDKQGVIEYVNPSFTKLTGYSSGEVLGKNPRFLKSGNQSAEFHARLWSTVSSGELWHSAIVNRRKDGTQYSALMTISPILDKDGQITHYVGTQQDMTSHEMLEEKFRQSQKMEAIGTLVGGIAHDFNNMLTGINGNLYLAKKRVQEQPDVLNNLDNVEEISLHASEMIQQLLTFARKGKVNMKSVPLTLFIRETLKLLRTAVPENIDMRQDICSDALHINGDATQLHQVLMNLVNNARDALEGVDGPCITINLETFHADETFVESHSYFAVGLYARVSIADNGCGIPEHQVKHLFEPFFTTKEEGKGTGLGLAMVFGAVKTHCGFIEVESVEGEGTTFHIYLPLLESEDVATGLSQKQEVAKGHGEMILLVDDQQQVVDTGKEVLESLGYQVITAKDGWQAVEIFQAHAAEVDLCIFDIVMPAMGGKEAALCVRQINPHVKIIFCTGYDKDFQANMENETVLSKPFAIAELSHIIRQQLNA
jgi:PAS domain S-box-containing protein